jgi:hypothetical protein
VGKSGITIDLNRHRMTGTGAAYGINSNDGVKDWTVKNGTIRNFGFGVVAAQPTTSGVTIVGVSTIFSDIVGFNIGGTNNTLRNSYSTFDAAGVWVAGAKSTVSGVRITHADNKGIEVKAEATHNVLRSNVINATQGVGLSISGDLNTFTRNTLTANGHVDDKPGVELLGPASGNELTKNVITGSSTDGINDVGSTNTFNANRTLANGFDEGSSNTVNGGLDASGAINPIGQSNISHGNDTASECEPTSLCTPPAPAFVLEDPPCGSFVTHSFSLSADKSCETLSTFTIIKSGVTVDLNRHEISTAGGGYGGIHIATDVKDVTIKNGTVRGFTYGIAPATGVRSITIVDVSTVFNSFGIGLLSVPDATVKKTFSTFDTDGIIIGGNDSSVTGSVVTESSQYGIELRAGAKRLLASKNIVSSTGWMGVLMGASASRATGNTVLGNGHPDGHVGIRVYGNQNVLSKNRVSGNSDEGIQDVGTSNTFVLNYALVNGYDDGTPDGSGAGIDASGATTPKGEDNRAYGNDAPTQCDPSGLC